VPPAADKAWTAATVHYEATYDKLHELVERSTAAYNADTTVKIVMQVALALVIALLSYYVLPLLLRLVWYCIKGGLRLTKWAVTLPFR
jgi:hypothetical protein